tara:strand:- start:791 stop:1399 length:609 start_codon:yes stop_codon:yes gene_type:complete
MKHNCTISGSLVLWGVFLAISVSIGLHVSALADPARSELSVGQMRNFTFFDDPKPIPEVSFMDSEGQKLGLANFRGKFVLVNLWATWCGPCRREMPSLDRLQARLSGSDFTVLALSQDRKGIAIVEKFLTQIDARNLEIYIDSSAQSARQLGAIGLPTTVLLDRNSHIIGRLIGSAEWDSNEAAHLIKAIIQDYEGLSARAQ